MKTINLLFTGLILVFALACKTKAPEKSVVNTDSPISAPDPAMIKNNNSFAFDLYRNIGHNSENMFYSPFSISAALGMTYTGSKGNTEKQMSAVMHFAPNNAEFYGNYKAYLASVGNLNNDKVSIYTANSFWAQLDYKFKKEFIEIIRNHFSGEGKSLNFRNEAEKCRIEINKWVEEKTNNKIAELIKPGLIDDLTRLVLVNAIYFKAPWEMPFDEKATRQIDFKTSETATVSTDFMIAENNYKYYTEDDLTAIEIPYAKNTLSMLIILPKDNKTFEALQKNIDGGVYDKINAGLTVKKVRLFMPKFKTTSEFELSEVLKVMGMPEAFSDLSDFSGMTGKKDLKISKVVHKAFIDVNEAGTEAAAATAVIIRVKSAPMNVIECKVDHPFMFIIKENTHGSILFAGNIYDPTK